MILAHRLVKGIANRILDKSYIRPRNFSNRILKKYVSNFNGEVINVSGWRDEDGEGNHYKNYFKNANSYTVSNVSGHGNGLGSAGSNYNEIEIDLTKDISDNLMGKFDVVFNHTTLEHVFNFQKAFKDLCDLSRDAVIIVVPVMQQIHQTADFGDYWRPTTMTIARMFLDNGFEPLVIKCNDQPFAPIYCFAIASKNPNKYKDKFPENVDFEMGSYNYGSSLREGYISEVISRERTS